MNMYQITQASDRKGSDFIDLPKNADAAASDIFSDRVKTLIALVCLFCVAVVLRLYLLTNQSFWFDEGATLAMTDSASLGSTYDALMAITGGDKYQPLYFFVLALWRSVVGESEFALRLFSVIPGVLTPIVVYFAVKPLFGVRHALLSSVFLVCSGFCIAYSQELRPYAFLLFLAAVQLMVLSPALSEPEKVPDNRLMLTLVTLIASFSSILLILFSAILALSHLLTFRQWQVWLRTWTPVCLGSLPVLIYYWTAPAIGDVTADAINGSGLPIWKNLLFSQYGHLAGQTFGPSLESIRSLESFGSVLVNYFAEISLLAITCAALLICALLNIAGGYQQGESARNKIHFVVIFYCLSVIGALCLAVVTKINWMPRHSFYLMIPLSLLLPLALDTASSKLPSVWRSSQSALATGAFATLLAINLYASSNYFHNSDHWRDDYRAAAAYLQENVGEKDRSFMLWGEPYLVSYYGHKEIESLWRLEDEDIIMSHIVEANSIDAGRVFIAINREYSWASHSPELIQLLDSSFELVPAAQFNNFNIYQLDSKLFSGEVDNTLKLN